MMQFVPPSLSGVWGLIPLSQQTNAMLVTVPGSKQESVLTHTGTPGADVVLTWSHGVREALSARILPALGSWGFWFECQSVPVSS